MACNKHAIDEAYKILSNYQDSEHCYEKGEKQKRFILTFICCVDTKYGNTNALTDEWFLGKDGFFFKDVDENIYKTNSKSFNSFSDDHDLIEGQYWNPGTLQYAVKGIQSGAASLYELRKRWQAARGETYQSVNR